MIRRISFTLLIFLLGISPGFSNAAQPGLRTAGGMGGFTLLFPEDSTSFQKIQMVKERVNIHLYPGYAVVKGTYWMQNDTEDTITIKTGYPINAHFSTTKNASDLTEIFFDKLYALRVSISGVAVDYEKMVLENGGNKVQTLSYDSDPQWYIWTTAFQPGETPIEVYFVLNTNEATVSQGYNSDSPNGFIYVLETGASWKPPIGEGTISVQFMGDLTVDNIKGVSPDSVLRFSPEGNFLFWKFEDLIPDHEDNLVITYGHRVENFDFESVLARKEGLFNKLDVFSNLADEPSGDLMVFPSPFEVSGSGNAMMGIIMFVALYGLPILGIIFVLLFIFWLIRRKKHRSKG